MSAFRRVAGATACVLALCACGYHHSNGFPTARPFSGLAPIGRLATGKDGCTATVVQTATHNIALTAAHCLVGEPTAYTFTPMSHDQAAPFGVWRVRSAFVDGEWLAHQSPADDFAFVVLEPEGATPAGKRIQDVVGGFRLASTPPPQNVLVVGYPNGKARPVQCANRFDITNDYPTFDCNGFPNGTSGGPWLDPAEPNASGDALYGIIGGLHQGGCSPSTSYSPRFGASIQALLERAEEGGSPDARLPTSSNGC